MKLLATGLATLSAASLVAGHGYVTNGTIGGKYYEFYQPYEDPYTSPTPERISRPIQGNGPVEDVTIQDIQCGGYLAGGVNGSSPAALHAPATAGSDVTLHWTLWPSSHYGSIITYMARCPDTGCQDYMPYDNAVWFKIKEGGLIDKTTNEWAVDSLEVNGNAGYTYTIPECLADGFYLVRHEIIAVFIASSYPGAQFYPGCHQLNVTGGGSTVVSDLVSFPGAYAGTDPGITWDSTSTTYPIPGPTVYTCDGSSGSSSSAASSVASETAAATSTAVATSSAVAVETSSASSVVSSAATTLATAVASSSTVAATSTAVAAETTSVAVAAASTSAASVEVASSTSAVASATSTAKSCSKKRGLRRNKRSRSRK
ncbi:Polysaccharide monooxygenase Cel61a [Cytospora mali]|uniref:lytic cellulose monooxygenase (C4-dehydrogenating) n=1 Tax=Cytospora mali TaxID=578113 RepID=A0A194UXT8_CYTMA|nr:Polysaccharide monooxygenase Cel61a [Valsa mali var. pyri (nom. inval.)]